MDFTESSIADLATTPRTRIAKNEDRDRLLEALRQLPLEQQLVLELHYWEEMDGEQLTEVFDIALATTRSRLFRARQALREKLAKIKGVPASATTGAEGLEEWVRSLQRSSS